MEIKFLSEKINWWTVSPLAESLKGSFNLKRLALKKPEFLFVLRLNVNPVKKDH